MVIGERKETDTVQHPLFITRRKRTQAEGGEGRKTSQACEILKDTVNSDPAGWRRRWALGPWTSRLGSLPSFIKGG